MKRLSNHPAASDEIDKAYTWFALRSVQAADSFYEELFLTVKRLHRQPTLFQRYLRGTRRAVLDQNPYPVIFRELPRKIEIIAVAMPSAGLPIRQSVSGPQDDHCSHTLSL